MARPQRWNVDAIRNFMLLIGPVSSPLRLPDVLGAARRLPRAGGDTLAVVAVGLLLPFSPLAGPLGFVPLPGAYFLLGAATATYLVEIAKRLLARRLLPSA